MSYFNQGPSNSYSSGLASPSRRRWVVTLASAVAAPPLLYGIVSAAAYMIDEYENSPKFACSREPGSIHNILLDTSDPISLSQTSQIETLLAEYLKGSRAGDVTNLFVLAEDPRRPINLMTSVCDTGGMDEYTRLTETRADIEAQRDRMFFQPLKNAVSAAHALTPLSKTPLIEAIAHLSSHANFQGGFSDRSPNIRLQIVSDLLQHTAVSAYDDSLNSAAANDYIAQFVVRMDKVELSVAKIHRPEHRRKQLDQHLAWFDAHLNACGMTMQPVSVLM